MGHAGTHGRPKTRRRALAAVGLLSASLAPLACAAVLGIPGDVGVAEADAGTLPGLEAAAPEASSSGDGGETPEAAPGDAAADAPADAPSDGDAGPVCPAVVACDLAQPFGAPVLLGGVSSPFAEGTARLSEDERTITFCSLRNLHSFDLFQASRSCVGDAFGAPRLLPELSTTTHNEYGGSITDDGTRIFFERQALAQGGGNADIFFAVRAGDAGPFGTPQPVPGVNDVRPSNYEASPFVRGSGDFFWFAAFAGGSTELFTAEFRLGGDFAGRYETKRLTGPVNSPTADENEPVVSRDGLHLYFSRVDRLAPATKMDIWEAHRASADVDFDAPTLVPNVQSDESEAPFWLSGDGCRLYLWSERAGAGNQDLYVATRPPAAP